jgi:hypothetical protein
VCAQKWFTWEALRVHEPNCSYVKSVAHDMPAKARSKDRIVLKIFILSFASRG